MKILLLMPLLLLAACSSFDNRWKSEPVPSIPNTLAGKWNGQWASFAGHRGNLRAIIQPVTSTTRPAATQPAARLYHATFQSTWGLLNVAEYTVDFTATPTDDGETFSGQNDLGPLSGGIYRYAGVLHLNDLQTLYSASLDHGTFTLHRAK